MVTVGYISSCSSLNFFNLVNLGSSMGIPYSRGILQFWSNKCFIGMRSKLNIFVWHNKAQKRLYGAVKISNE